MAELKDLTLLKNPIKVMKNFMIVSPPITDPRRI
jgi:hypothetical protein